MEYVLDTSAILSGRQFTGDLITSPKVLEELPRMDLSLEEEAFMDRVKVFAPGSGARKKVSGAAKSSGDIVRLSPTDLELLALALDRGATLVTDDYSMQNVAATLGIPYRGVQEPGIRKVFTWYLRCTGCGRYLDRPRRECPTCGSPVRTTRRPPSPGGPHDRNG